MTAHDQSVSAKLTRFSLQRRITVLVMFFTIIVVGIVATLGIPLELFPRGFSGSSLSVFVPWREAPVREVLDKITLPLEEEVSTIRGIDGINSFTTVNGSRVFLRFKQGTNMDVAYREVKDRIERARARFPDDADRVFVNKEDTSGIPVAVIGIAIDEGFSDIYQLIQRQIVLPFQRIEGVASVNVNGLEPKEIIIEVDREKLEGHGLNIYDLSQQLGGDNFTLASGSVRDSGKKFLLRSVARYDNLLALENRPVTGSVRLKDVATIRYEEAEKNYSVRVNSNPAYALIVMKEGEANTIQVSEAINKTMTALAENPRLKEIEMISLFNQGDVIRNSLGDVTSSGRIGAIFAVLVLFFFLRRLRLTAIITLSIPVSIIMALVVMYFAGESLNVLSLLALVICIGLLVDNSVVVAENIFRRFQEGMSLRDACIHGAGEIGLAITMATLTTVVVFLPVSLVKGQAQFFLLRLAIPITVSLLASLLVALIFIPLSTYLTVSARHDNKGEGFWIRLHALSDRFLDRAYDASFGALNRWYSRVLGFFLRWRFDLIVTILIVMGVTGGVAFKNVKFTPVDEESQRSFRIMAELPRHTTFEEAKTFFKDCETVLANEKEALDLSYYFIFHRTRSGEIQGSLNEGSETKRTMKELAKALLEKLPKRPGINYYLGEEDQDEDTKDKDVFSVVLQGDDLDLLDIASTNVVQTLLNAEGVLGQRKSEEARPNQLAFVVDRERAQQAEVNPQVIAGVIGFALRGSALPKYRDEGREIPVRVRFEEADRQSLEELKDFAVPDNRGGILALDTISDVRMTQSPNFIFRRDKRISRTITLELEPENLDQTRRRLVGLTKQIDLPEGITFGAVINPDNNGSEARNILLALGLSVVFIYLLMGFLFESFVLPLSIITTIPLAGIGVGWVHFIANKDMDFLGGIGLVLLVGVVVNNGIVLIDYVIRLRKEGRSRTQALIEATDQRFRPIAMTALTTICGMVPLTFGPKSEMGLDYTSFGLTLIGGMTTATLLTLLIVPVFYTIFDDARELLQALVRRYLPSAKSSNPPAETPSPPTAMATTPSALGS